MFSARNKIQKTFVFGHSLEYNGKKYSKNIVSKTQWIFEYPHIDGKVNNYTLTQGVEMSNFSQTCHANEYKNLFILCSSIFFMRLRAY